MYVSFIQSSINRWILGSKWQVNSKLGKDPTSHSGIQGRSSFPFHTPFSQQINESQSRGHEPGATPHLQLIYRVMISIAQLS